MALFDNYSDPYFPDYGGGDQGDGLPIAPMPSFAGNQPPPKRLSYEEILAHLQKPAMPDAPDPYTSFGALPADQQKSGKLDALWAGLAALSGGMTSHQWGPAATEGTAAIQGIQDKAVKQANAAQDAAYQTQLAAAQVKAEQERTRQQAAALSGMFNRATANEDPMSPFSQQAADAARAGDMSSLEKMASPEVQSQRAAAKARGLNPDAWDTIEQLKGTLKDTLAAQSLKTLAGPTADAAALKVSTLSGPEATAAALKAKAEQDAKMPGEMALKLAPSYQQPLQLPPISYEAAKAAAIAAARAPYDKKAAGQPRLVKSGDQWGTLAIGPDGAGVFSAAKGQPKTVGGKHYWTDSGTGQQWVAGLDPDHPENAYPVQQLEEDFRGAAVGGDVTSGAGGRAIVQPAPPGAVLPPVPATPSATQKLGAIADPVLAAKIKVARQKGISDAAIAAHLGL